MRRAKATSNICTHQGLLVTAATIHMPTTGPEGLRRVPVAPAANLAALSSRLLKIPGVRALRGGQSHFHEAALVLPKLAQQVNEQRVGQHILAGFFLGCDFAGQEIALLVCVTETRSAADNEVFAAALEAALA